MTKAVIPLIPSGLNRASVYVTNYTQLTGTNQTATFQGTIFDVDDNVLVEPQTLSVSPGGIQPIDATVRERRRRQAVEGFMVLEGMENFSPATGAVTYAASEQAEQFFRFITFGQFVGDARLPVRVRQPVGVAASAPEALSTRVMVINSSHLAREGETLNLNLSLTNRDLETLSGVVIRSIEPGRAFVFDVDELMMPPEQSERLFNAMLHIREEEDLLLDQQVVVFAVATSPVGKNYLLPPAGFTR